jgi:hypothetical protein
MDGDADQLERAVADGKAELAAEVERVRARAGRVRRSVVRRSVGGAIAAATMAGALRFRLRHR